MDFIEQIFGVAPDGGDGTTEMLYIAVALAVGVMTIARRWLSRRAAPLVLFLLGSRLMPAVPPTIKSPPL
ncbi:MAG: hypothetical protein EOR73_32095 [Mesorhizobium sp.]|nr:MAG: hypothetical protein EOR73_32095 [Mesorhizobium sp.]